MEVLVGLIIAIIAAVVIIFIALSSGLIANFKETIGVLMILFSAYTRIVIVALLNMLLWGIAVLMLFVTAAFMIRWGPGVIKAVLGSGSPSLSALGGTAVGGLPMLVFIVYSVMVSSTFSMIPFFGAPVNVYLGSAGSPYNYTTVASDIADRIDTAWKVMGANSGNPLEGLSHDQTPNPFPVFVIFPYPNQTITMDYVYEQLKKKNGNRDPDYDIYVFCKNSVGYVGKEPWTSSINPVCWFSNCGPLPQRTGRMYARGECDINNKTEVFVEYADTLTGLTAPLASSGISKDENCKYMTGVGQLDRDVMVICIKER